MGMRRGMRRRGRMRVVLRDEVVVEVRGCISWRDELG
jgi:hypothetical protein